ncbi:hypothetical protein F5Y10DRAFT_251093 [Nemania abortiva]|nr:hypothetical protein F5Y10DRAFT_251093 [Nemania abortiva]
MNVTTTLTGWQDSPPRRGTLGIIENCLATIFTCTWTIQHLNIPAKMLNVPVKSDSTFKIFRRTLKWMTISILLPEFILAHAIFELTMAIQALDAMNNAGLIVKYPLWVQIFRQPNKTKLLVSLLSRNKPASQLSQENELAIRPSQNDEPASRSPFENEPSIADRVAPWTLTHAYFANMGGFVWEGTLEGDDRPQRYIITGHEIARQGEYKNISNGPQYEEDTIKDKSKSDAFAKSFAVLQSLQLVLSLVVRKVRQLPISQLEIVTLAFAVCGIATFLLRWYKPRNIAVPLPIDLKSRPRDVEYPFNTFYDMLMNRSRSERDNRIPNDNIPINYWTTNPALYLLAFLSVVLGSLHAIAWSFEFSTQAEKTAWRVATIASIIIPPAGLLAVPLSQYHLAWGNPQDFMTGLCALFDYGIDRDNLQFPPYEIVQVRNNLFRICSMPALDENSKVKFSLVFYPILQYCDPNHGTGRPNRPFIALQLLTRLHSMRNTAKRSKFTPGPARTILYNSDFGRQINHLADYVTGTGPWTMVERAARTNVYPRREIFGRAVNRSIVLLTTILYCSARLAILALTLSSLRKMPDGVYITTWTKYIPAVQ